MGLYRETDKQIDNYHEVVSIIKSIWVIILALLLFVSNIFVVVEWIF